MKVKDAGKLDSQAVEGHFVGYDEESKGYHLYFPKCRSIMVERDVYFNKDAVVEVGDVVFKGESKEPTAEAGFSNPMVSNDNAISAPENAENLEPDAPEIIPKMASKPLDVPNPPEISKIPSLDFPSMIWPNMDMGK